MATPSFEELLSEARAMGESRAKAQDFKTANVLAQVLPQLAAVGLFANLGNDEKFVGELSEDGAIKAFDRPQQASRSLFDVIRGVPKMEKTTGIPLTQEQATNVFLKTLPTTVLDPVTGKVVTQTVGKPAFLQQERAGALDTKPAIGSGFSRLDEIRELFPELTPDKYGGVPVSEVKARRANKRAEIYAGLRSATGEEAKDLASGDVLRGQISRIKNLAASTNYKGIGPGAAVLGKLGEYSPVEAFETDADTVELYQQINDVMNQMVYLRSGKQINEQEFARLKAAFPAPNLNETAFKRRLDTFSTVFEEVMAAREARIKGAGRRTGGGFFKSQPDSLKVGGSFEGKKILKVERVK